MLRPTVSKLPIQCLTELRLFVRGSQARVILQRHWPPMATYLVVAVLFMWPMFAPGSPPGVDAPTFLHLSWVMDQALTGQLQSFFIDPYWYGGFPYLAYPPLSYGLVGLLSALSPLPVEISYRIFMLLAFAGLGVATYALALEFLGGRWLSAWVGLLAMLSYPAFASIGVFGWFSTLIALPFAVGCYTLLERALRTNSTRGALGAGVLFGATMLAHHMTAFALLLGLVPWVACTLGLRLAHSRPVGPTLSLFARAGLGAVVVAGPWLAFAVPHIIQVGFQREIPGNWNVSVDQFRLAVFDRALIGRETYPLYLGFTQVWLGVAGALLALVSRDRAWGSAIVLLTFAAFSLGSSTNPLIRLYPFSGLDVARFSLFMVPFAALLAGVFAQAVIRDVRGLFERYLSLKPKPTLLEWFGGGRRPQFVIAAAAVLALVLPMQDAFGARRILTPVPYPSSDLSAATQWLREHTEPTSTVLDVGFRNWGSYWIPREAGRSVMGGWHDEGTSSWRSIREVRYMQWFGNPNTLRLEEIMAGREADFVLVYQWQPIDSPGVFRDALASDDLLFKLRADWDGGVSIFERVGQ